MRRLALIFVVSLSVPGVVAAQTHGPNHGRPDHLPPAYGSGGHAHPGLARDGAYGNPHAYRPPVQAHTDRGGRYGYSTASGQWNRWSSPPGRGYHDVYGYNDDRAPRSTDRARRSARETDCNCGYGPYLRDR